MKVSTWRMGLLLVAAGNWGLPSEANACESNEDCDDGMICTSTDHWECPDGVEISHSCESGESDDDCWARIQGDYADAGCEWIDTPPECRDGSGEGEDDEGGSADSSGSGSSDSDDGGGCSLFPMRTNSGPLAAATLVLAGLALRRRRWG